MPGQPPSRFAALNRALKQRLDELHLMTGLNPARQPPLRTEPVSGPLAELTSHTTVRTPACQASWLG